MEVVKGESIEPGAKSFLIIGAEKTGKTSFMGSIAKFLQPLNKKALIFACEEGTKKRLGGLPNVDFIECYPTRADFQKASELPLVKNATDPERKAKELIKSAEGFAWKRFAEAHTECLLGASSAYDFGGIDSANYLQDLLLKRIEEVNGKTGFDLWRDAKKMTATYVEQLMAVFEYYVVTVHVKTADDDTVNREMFTAALQGSYRDVIGGKFDAVLHSITKSVGPKTEYLLQALPDGMHKAGIRVPMGMEDGVQKEMPNDFAKINELLKKGIKK